MNSRDYNFIISCPSNMKPKAMMDQLKSNLPIRHWRVVYNTKYNFRIVCQWSRKTKFLFLATNFSSTKPSSSVHRKLKFPKESYSTIQPQLIDEYNTYKGNVDLFDKMVQTYWRNTKFVGDDYAYTIFFFHTCVHQAFIASNNFCGYTFKDRDQLAFRMELVSQLREQLNPSIEKLRVVHKRLLFQNEQKKFKKCHKKSCQNKTRYYCPACDNLPYCLKHMDENHCKLLNNK